MFIIKTTNKSTEATFWATVPYRAMDLIVGNTKEKAALKRLLFPLIDTLQANNQDFVLTHYFCSFHFSL